jgi:hypothetical protein
MIELCTLGHGILRIFKPRKAHSGITFFEVKELYNLAYEQKAMARSALRQYRRMEARAKLLDDAYRAQLRLQRRAA